MNSGEVFDFEGYLESFRENSHDFMSRLINTQAFSNFIEETYRLGLSSSTTPTSTPHSSLDS